MTDAVAVLDPGWRALDSNADVVSGAVLYFYIAGTSTPATVYSDAGLLTALGSSVTCDSAGYPTSDGNTKTLIYTGTSSYKVTLKDSDGNTIWSHDNVRGADVIPTSSSTGLPTTPVVSKTSTYTIVSGDQGKLINGNPTGGSFAVTLPSAVTVGDAWRVGVRHAAASSNAVTVRSTGGQTIGLPGQTSATSISLAGLGHTMWFVSDGAGWHVDTVAPPLMQGGLPFVRITDRLTAPPASPVGGARYICNGTATGVWATLSVAEHDVVESDGNGSWLKYTPANGWMAWVDDEDIVSVYHDAAWDDWSNVTAPSTSTLETAVFLDQRADGTVGGTATTGAWTTRTLQTTATNNITDASLATNQVTLPTGTYLVRAWAYQERTNSAGLRIKQGASTYHYGISGNTATDAATMLVDAIITIAGASDTIELQYYAQSSSSTNDLGRPVGIAGNLETYASVAILDLTSVQGPAGAAGPQGADGLDAAHAFQWAISTSGDPGSGKIAANNATLSSATQIQISQTSALAVDMAGIFGSWDDSTSTSSKGRVRIAGEDNPSIFWEFRVTAAGTDQGAYWTFPIAHIDNGGTLTDAMDMSLLFVDIGDKGDPGTTVPDISGLTSMTTGQIDRTADQLVIYDNSTGSHKKLTPDVMTEPWSFEIGASDVDAAIMKVNDGNGLADFIVVPDQIEFAGTIYIGSAGSPVLSHTDGAGGIEARYSTAVGSRCLTNMTTGSYNVGVGFEVMENLTTGRDNTGVGEAALIYITTGNGNTAVGWKALLGNSGGPAITGSYNTGVGYNVMNKLTTAVENTALGKTAGTALTTGGYNTLLGSNAGLALTTGIRNVALGSSALLGATTANDQLAIGYLSLNSSNGSNNVGVGFAAGHSITSGTANTCIGYQCQTGITTGSNNVVIGTNYGTGITTGSGNVIIGTVTGLAAGLANHVILADGGGTMRLGITSSGLVGIGGITSSFAALKSNSAVLETKLADDSAYAIHAASYFKTTTALNTATDGSGIAAFVANMIASTGGPATANQHGWMKMKDSAGADVWVPVWK